MKLEPGTKEYEEAKILADKKVESFKWQLKYLIGSQYEKTPEKTQFILGAAFEQDYVKFHLSEWLTKMGFKVWLNRGIFGDLVIDWSNNVDLPKTTILPMYQDEKNIWKEIIQSSKED